MACKRLVIVCNHQTPTYLLVLLNFQCLSSECWDGEDSAAWQPRRHSLDARLFRVKDRCQQSDVEERLCHSNGHFLSKTNGVRLERHRTAHMQLRQAHSSERSDSGANTLTFVAVITCCSVQLFTHNDHAEFQDGDLLKTVILISPLNDVANHVGRNFRETCRYFF